MRGTPRLDVVGMRLRRSGGMARSQALRANDMAALLRLAGEVSELPSDKLVRRQHVLAGFLKLVGGYTAVAFKMADPGEGAIARPGTVVHVDATSELARRRWRCTWCTTARR